MFALPGICGLIVVVLARPQEAFEALQRVPLLHGLCALALAGHALDVAVGRATPRPAPALGWVVAFAGWAALCTAIRAPAKLPEQLVELAVLGALFVTLSAGVQRFRGLRVVAATLAATALALAVVCWHQGQQPRSCVVADPLRPGEGVPDGRRCELAVECLDGDPEPGADYRCEKVGWLGTYAVEDRVRYRGELHDPNELALTLCVAGLSLLVGLARLGGGAAWGALAVAGAGLVLWTVLLTQSRGGLLVMLTIPAVYAVRRYGLAALAPGAALAALALALGGRSGAAADASTTLRYEAWAAGLDMLRSSPLVGVGMRQFTEHHAITAHNSYVLTLAELGLPGCVLWVSILWLSVKTLLLGVRQLDGVPGARPARVWGMALLASFAGLLVQISTLSFAYHSVLWLFLGLAGAYAQAVRHHHPGFEVRLGARELVAVTAGCVALATVILPLWLRFKHVR